MVPYLLGFAVLCLVLSYGVQKRTVWMWYAGWVIFYLMASYFGSFFFAALERAQSPQEEAFACLYLVGGLLFWLPQVLLWVRHRQVFGVGGRALAEKRRRSRRMSALARAKNSCD